MARVTFRERVGDRLRALREARGLTQKELARLLPGTVEGTQISRWERGENFPNPDNIEALARALEVSPERLVCGCDP